MSRPVWKGSISFGLVSIPIELKKAVEHHSISFKTLHATCHTPLKSHRWCPHCHEDVAWDEVVKGMKLDDGSFITFKPEELKELKPERTQAISIGKFVDAHEVAPLYFDKHYYVVPQSDSDKAYFLLTAALAKYKQAAIGQFVMRDKDAVCLIQPYGDGLLLTTLNYAYEILPMPTYKEMPKISSKELTLAHTLMKQLYSKSFDISAYKDTFADRLKKALIARKEGKVIKPKKEVKPRPKVSLMDALRQSVEQGSKRR